MNMDEVRHAATAGVPLGNETRYLLEKSFEIDLSAIRIHTGGTADRLTRSHRTDALAAGTHLFFRNGAYRPQCDSGLALVAHEVAHSLQQQARDLGPHSESEAELAGASVVAGRTVHLHATPGALVAEPPFAVQCHESFEHRCLGDLPTPDIFSIASKASNFNDLIERETALMWKWHQNPENVTRNDLPGLLAVQLPESGLLVTYGELNALPDYIASADAIDTCPKSVLLPILQAIRQETYVQLNALRNQVKNDRFQYSPYGPNDAPIGLLNKVFNSWALDDLTSDLGINGEDHYLGLLGRNACHFAPYTWYRWQASYLTARDLATRAHQASGGEKDRLTTQAWIFHGYADHFLQDSFAAGHLLNKTLVMQWFVKWAANSNLYIEDWDLIKDMTVALEPAIAGQVLYDPAYTGLGTDPQTVNEQATYEERLGLSGVKAFGSVDQRTAYQRYLAFLSSVITQAASNAVHDAFNERSVWVASEAQGPYRVYGDDTLFTGAGGAQGAQITSETAQMSQQSIRDLLSKGSTDIGTADIRKHFPTRAGDDEKSVKSLGSWVAGQEQWACDNVFNTAAFLMKRVFTQAFPRILNFSKDQEFANKWYTSLPDCGYHYTDALLVGERMFAGSNGYAYELEAMNGKVKWHDGISNSRYETHLASNGSLLYAGCNGYVEARRFDTWDRAWKTPMTGSSSWPVHLLFDSGRLFAGSNGAVHELDPVTGKRLHSLDVSSAVGWDVRLATDGKMLFAGCHGYAYGISLNDWSKIQWTTPMTDAAYVDVSLLYAGGMLFAGSNGSVHQINASVGGRTHSLGLSGAVGESVRMTLTDDGLLAAGCHGYTYGIRTNDWSKVAWSTPMAGKLWEMVEVSNFGGNIYACSNGYVQRLRGTNGAVLNSTQLSTIAGSGDYTPSMRISPKSGLFIGMHGYVYNMLL